MKSIPTYDNPYVLSNHVEGGNVNSMNATLIGDELTVKCTAPPTNDLWGTRSLNWCLKVYG
jgi:hypothetical protein